MPPMRRRIQMFFSVVLLFGSLAGAAAINDEVRYWNAAGTLLVTPDWARWLAVGVLILGIASPIVTWPRPIIMWRRPKA
jgi:hypothetical protein